jgi:trehalose synthase
MAASELIRAKSWVAAILIFGCLTSSAIAQSATTGNPPAADSSSAAQQKWSSPDYIHWLEQHSMLKQSEELAVPTPDKAAQRRHPFAQPQPEAALEEAPVWLLAYPGSVITSDGQSVIATWSEPKLWDALAEIGITLLHTGPINLAGSIEERSYKPTIDGWFDPISLEVDPALGTRKECDRLLQVASAHRAVIASDLVPLHTGKGADFLLAIRAYKNYSGMYTMAEIDKEDWPLLPRVDSLWKTALVSDEVAEKLRQRGYIPGRINSCDADPEVRKSSGWSATGEIEGVDGKPRRWVYLHYFKPGQPALDWLDPSCTAQQVVAGSLKRTIDQLGAKIVRLDAVPFLGIEPKSGDPTAYHYQHPLSILDTDYLAFLARRLGGWTFQELNAPLPLVKRFLTEGPDLSYDFFTRTEGLHALLTGDAALLRQAYGSLLASEVQPLRLVHDLQNHDEITYQLVGLEALGDETVQYHGRAIAGRKLREQVLEEMRAKAAGDAAPYNLLYRPTRDGVATTFAGFVAAALGIRDLELITPEQKAEIQRGHLLLAFANAMQPGVFCLSSWDLVGALPLERATVEERFSDGDYRWINRGGVDLLGNNPGAKTSAFGLPRARALYEPLPEQLKDENSFVSQLKRLLAVRKKYHVELAKLLAAPETDNSALCVLVMRGSEPTTIMITALNFSRAKVSQSVDLYAINELRRSKLSNMSVLDAVTGQRQSDVDGDGKVMLELDRWSGKMFVIGPLKEASGLPANSPAPTPSE